MTVQQLVTVLDTHVKFVIWHAEVKNCQIVYTEQSYEDSMLLTVMDINISDSGKLLITT